MKRFLALTLAVFMLLGLCACGGNETPATTQPSETTAPVEPTVDPNYDPVNNDKTLKVLAIGNSFSNDTTHFLEDIARAEGFETVLVGNLYISGCTLQTHALNVLGNLPAYKYYMNYDGEWKTIQDCTLEYALKDQDWDIITMQQGSTWSGKPETYEPHLTQLIEYVNENKTNPNARFAWNMTWAYQADFQKDMFAQYGRNQDVMYHAIISTVQSTVQAHKEIAYIMPCGTAIQNARTSYVGDTLTRDGYHMSELGRVITSYTWLATFLNEPLTEINFTNVSDTLTLTEQDKAMILESVNNAIKNPFAVTNSTYTEAK